MIFTKFFKTIFFLNSYFCIENIFFVQEKSWLSTQVVFSPIYIATGLTTKYNNNQIFPIWIEINKPPTIQICVLNGIGFFGFF